MSDCSSAPLTMRSKSGLGGKYGGTLAATQPATPVKHGITDANSIARRATERAASRDAARPTGARTPREPCATCGTTAWVEAVFSNHALYCADCAREIRRVQESPPMPPNANERRQLSLWCRPQSRCP